LEIRKAQRAGYSTLIVSLPIKWVKEVGVKPGDTLALSEEQDGSLRVIPQLGLRTKGESVAIVNADLCAEKELLAKIIVGEYIVGHETIQVSSKRPLRPEQLEEIRNATSKLIGIGVVEQTLNRVTLQSLVDPMKFPIYVSLRRIHAIIIAIFDAILHAISERETKYLKEVSNMENDVDRLYRLTVRQLILAARDREIMKHVGIESPLNIVGNRVVAKALEEIADNAERIAIDALSPIIEKNIDVAMLRKISPIISLTKSVAESSLDSFFKKDIRAGSKALLAADNAIKECNEVADLVSKTEGRELAISLSALLWNLVQAIRQYKIIAEITINRALEESTEISSIIVKEE